MERVNINLSNIKEVGHEDETLEVLFQNKCLYRYKGVPDAVYTEMLQAEHPQQFFSREIRGHYEWEKVGVVNDTEERTEE